MPRRTSKPTQLLHLVSALPWWVSLLVAVVSYFGLNALAGLPLPNPEHGSEMSSLMVRSVIRGFASAGQYIVPIVFVIGAVAGAARRAEGHLLINRVAEAGGTDALNQMSWQQFERLSGATLQRMGFDVIENGRGGADGGVDLHASKGGQRFVVQCKQWRSTRVGVTVVREHFGVIMSEGVAGGIVMTSGTFTPEAIEFAVGKPITLVDGAQLSKAISAVSQSAEPQSHHTFDPAAPQPCSSKAPACPVCRSEMVMRQKRGGSATDMFWGCPKFPKCRGTRSR